ncbi:hypothetical protein CE195_09735 [Sodalis-like symbiont of Philaenus spumarius]|nr:hypothetical protein CE195_09735 [Sodalis-like symbiont of Philaenus spumarius]
MDEFKSEDELRPDSSDRRRTRQRKVLVSKQHLMIGIGILVLLLLVISIGAALKSPSRTDSGRQGADNNGQRNIALSGSTSDSDASPSSPGATAPAAVNGNNGASSTQELSAPQMASTPPKAALVKASGGGAGGSIQSAPAGYYTLQLSSASQPATLNAYARQQKLYHYWVYQTRRDGKPWYVLVNGVYPSLSQAKNAVAQLPADVQAKKPWARQIGQVKKD